MYFKGERCRGLGDVFSQRRYFSLLLLNIYIGTSSYVTSRSPTSYSPVWRPNNLIIDVDICEILLSLNQPCVCLNIATEEGVFPFSPFIIIISVSDHAISLQFQSILVCCLSMTSLFFVGFLLFWHLFLYRYVYMYIYKYIYLCVYKLRCYDLSKFSLIILSPP